jgi:hypothetical protein
VLWILFVCVSFVGLSIWIVRVGRNRAGAFSPLPAAIRDQPPILSSHTRVRQYEMYHWVDWASRYGGGRQLTIWPNLVEVSAPQGTVLEPRTIRLRSEPEGCTIRLDRVGLWGMPVHRRECIRIVATSADGTVQVVLPSHAVGGVVALDVVDLALTPDCGIDTAWNALVRSGCHPTAD